MNSSHQQTAIALSSGENSNITAVFYNELRIIKMSVYLLILFFSVTGNTLVILSVLFFQRLKTVPNFFIANLAACDFVTTVSSIPFDLVYEELGYWPYGGVMCKILWPLATFSTTSAVFTLLSISSDRYIALLHPLNFGKKISKKKCVVIILMVYVLAALAVIPYIVFLKYYPKPDFTSDCGEDWPALGYRKSYTVFLFSIQYAIPLPIMIYIYIRLGLLIYNSTRVANKLSGEKSPLSLTDRRKPSEQSTNSSLSYSNTNRRQMSIQRRKEQNEKTVKMFFLIVSIFLIFMLPNQILWILYDFGDPDLLSAHIGLVAFVCRAFTYTNSVLNALIYGLCNRNFRKAFKAILRCKCGKGYQRDLKRSLTIINGRSGAAHNRRESQRGFKQNRKSSLYRKPEQSETVDGTSNSYEEICQAQVKIADTTTNTENCVEPSPVNNNCTMVKKAVDSKYTKSDHDDSMVREGETCLLEAERLLNRICKEIDLEKPLSESGSTKLEPDPTDCNMTLNETTL